MSDKVATLERVELVNVGKDDLFEEIELADRAASVLGYDLLKKSATQRTGSSKIREVLKELDVRPFSIESVRKYRDLALRKANSKLNKLLLVMKVVGCFSLVSLLATMIFSGLKDAQIVVSLVGYSLCGTCFIASFVAFLVVFSLLLEKHMFQWVRVSIKEYSKPIPEFALQTALDVKKRLPEASFHVEELKFDPFLIVEHSGESFYLEVWNEPSFDKVGLIDKM